MTIVVEPDVIPLVRPDDEPDLPWDPDGDEEYPDTQPYPNKPWDV